MGRFWRIIEENYAVVDCKKNSETISNKLIVGIFRLFLRI
jgi:hypothetical protein